MSGAEKAAEMPIEKIKWPPRGDSNKSKLSQVLTLEPSGELTFNGPFTEYVNTTLTLSNPSARDVYFKVKTTAPKFYCVRPNSGLVKAHDKTQINVMLQPIESPEVLEMERSRHKFMIQSAFAPQNEDQSPVFYASAEDFWREVQPGAVMDSKMKVVFQAPFGISLDEGKSGGGFDNAAYTSAVSTNATHRLQHHHRFADSSTTSPGMEMASDPLAALQKEIELRKIYQDEKANLEKENFALMEKMEQLTRAVNSTGTAAITLESVPLLHTILLAIAAFLLGLIVSKLV